MSECTVHIGLEDVEAAGAHRRVATIRDVCSLVTRIASTHVRTSYACPAVPGVASRPARPDTVAAR